MTKIKIIPLGGGCDIAMNLSALLLRRESLLFDWLWNLDSGLKFTSDCISTDFRNVTTETAYEYKYHYRFQDDMCTYKSDNSVVHLHNNPLNNPQDHETLKRRVERTLVALKSNDFKLFIYYRAFPEDIIRTPHVTISESLDRLIAEGDEFIRVFETKYPEQVKNFKLVLILQTESQDLDVAKRLIEERNITDSKLNLELTIYRYNANQQQLLLWSKQFRRIIFEYIPKLTRLKITIKLWRNQCLSQCKSIIKCFLK